MQYGIEQSTELRDLERKVNMCLKEGWKLQGGVAIASQGVSSPYLVYCQAMVRDENPREVNYGGR